MINFPAQIHFFPFYWSLLNIIFTFAFLDASTTACFFSSCPHLCHIFPILSGTVFQLNSFFPPCGKSDTWTFSTLESDAILCWCCFQKIWAKTNYYIYIYMWGETVWMGKDADQAIFLCWSFSLIRLHCRLSVWWGWYAAKQRPNFTIIRRGSDGKK